MKTELTITPEMTRMAGALIMDLSDGNIDTGCTCYEEGLEEWCEHDLQLPTMKEGEGVKNPTVNWLLETFSGMLYPNDGSWVIRYWVDWHLTSEFVSSEDKKVWKEAIAVIDQIETVDEISYSETRRSYHSALAYHFKNPPKGSLDYLREGYRGLWDK